MKRIVHAFVYAILLAFISLFSVALLWKKPLLLSFLLILISGILLFIWRSKEDVVLYFVCGLGGALAEALAIVFGAWKYGQAGFMGIPYWLPFLWGIASLFVKRMSEKIHHYFHT